VGVLLLVAVAGVCAFNKPLHLLYAKHQLQQILDSVGYARQPVAPPLQNPKPPPNHLRFRTYDGSWNNLEHPEIGMADTPVGRYLPESGNVARDVLAEPMVVEISERLLKQDEFHSGAPFNALAMAWVNFFVHDFYNRGVTDVLHPPEHFYKSNRSRVEQPCFLGFFSTGGVKQHAFLPSDATSGA
jgi:hypothetical protein